MRRRVQRQLKGAAYLALGGSRWKTSSSPGASGCNSALVGERGIKHEFCSPRSLAGDASFTFTTTELLQPEPCFFTGANDGDFTGTLRQNTPQFWACLLRPRSCPGSSASRPLLSIDKVRHVELGASSDHKCIERVTDRTGLRKPE